jgi:glycosyltransferase involved in cell wall biosynthesis
VTSCIWYISKYVVVPEDQEPAGRSFALMREFARLGHRAVIITSDSMGKFQAPAAASRFQVEHHDGVVLWRIRTLKYAAAKSLRRMLSWLDFELRLLFLPKSRLPEPDAIIVSSLSLLTVLNGLRLRRLYNCRLVFEVRDIWPLTLVAEGGFSERNPLVLALSAVEKLGYRRADTVVGTMPNLGAHVERVLGHPAPVYCVPMGIDSDVVATAAPGVDHNLEEHLPTDKFLVAYAGSIGISNAMDVLFACAQDMTAFPNVHFLIVGDGELLASYKERFGSLPNVTFAPRVPKAQVQSILSRCDVLYLSTHRSEIWEYGQSLNKLIDYMMAGKPILASYSGFPSMINEADCGRFVPAGDVPALRDEILRFAEMSPLERQAMGQRGRDWLLANRCYTALAKQYLAILGADDVPSRT